MWQGDRNKTAESEGRALLPPPKAVWGSPGSGGKAFYFISIEELSFTPFCLV